MNVQNFIFPAGTVKRPNTTEWERFADSLWHRRRILHATRSSKQTLKNTIWPRRPLSSGFSDSYDEGYANASPILRVRRAKSQVQRGKLPNWKVARNLQRELLSRSVLVTSPTKLLSSLKNFQSDKMRLKNPLPAYASLSDSDTPQYTVPLHKSRPIIPTVDDYINPILRAKKINAFKSDRRPVRFIQTTTKKSLNNLNMLEENTNKMDRLDELTYSPQRKTARVRLTEYPVKTTNSTIMTKKSFIPIISPPNMSPIRTLSSGMVKRRPPLSQLPKYLLKSTSLNSLSSSDGVVVKPLLTPPSSSSSNSQITVIPRLNRRRKLPAILIPKIDKNFVSDINLSGRRSIYNEEISTTEDEDTGNSLSKLNVDGIKSDIVAADRCSISPNCLDVVHVEEEECIVCHKKFLITD